MYKKVEEYAEVAVMVRSYAFIEDRNYKYREKMEDRKKKICLLRKDTLPSMIFSKTAQWGSTAF
jgi:hypothetical protein